MVDGLTVPRATVVVPAYNAAPLLPVQLEALAAQVGDVPFEVVVADNGSTDDTAAVARSFAGRVPGLRVVDASGTQGVAHARNVGAAAARTAYVLFCDADDEVDPRWVAAMVTALDAGADVVGGPLDPVRLSPPQALSWRFTPPDDALPVALRFLPYATGANMGWRKAVLDRLGGFSADFQRGHEEVDLAWRAQLDGATIAFAPEAVIHYRLRDDLRGTMRQTFHYGRTQSQLFARHRSQPIPRTPWKKELRTYAILLRQGVGAIRSGHPHGWLCTMAWTAGRLAGDVQFRVRAPL